MCARERALCVSVHSAHFGCHFKMPTRSTPLRSDHHRTSPSSSLKLTLSAVELERQPKCNADRGRTSSERVHFATLDSGEENPVTPRVASDCQIERCLTKETEKSAAFPAFFPLSLTDSVHLLFPVTYELGFRSDAKGRKGTREGHPFVHWRRFLAFVIGPSSDVFLTSLAPGVPSFERSIAGFVRTFVRAGIHFAGAKYLAIEFWESLCGFIANLSQPVLQIAARAREGKMSDECVWGQDIFPAFCPQLRAHGSTDRPGHRRVPFQEIVILLVGGLEFFQPASLLLLRD